MRVRGLIAALVAFVWHAVAAAQAPTAVQADPGEKVYPINFATALQLAHARPLDIQVAEGLVALSAKQLDRAKLSWVPNLTFGADFYRHEGAQQNFAGEIPRSDRGSTMIGFGPNVVFNLSDALYHPLAARQDLKARKAAVQSATNDATLAVAIAYFDVQQARGELAGALLVLQKSEDVTKKAQSLAEGLAPPLEASRAKVELARRQQAATTAREFWRTASTELARLLRLEPGTLIDPIEPSSLPITVVPDANSLDALIPLGLTNRPELVGQQAFVQATLTRLKQEKLRPLVPSLALRSASTNPSGSLGYGGFAGGSGSTLGNYQSRFDLDLQILWEFQNLGFGNRARVGERQAELQLATLELFRVQDRIAAEIARAQAQSKAASERMKQTEPALKESLELVENSLAGMAQTRRVGEANVLIVRPQEVVAAIQSLGQANADYYAAIGDFNRAQFRLYRALGQPAESLSTLLTPPKVEVPKVEPGRLPMTLPPIPGEVSTVNHSMRTRTEWPPIALKVLQQANHRTVAVTSGGTGLQPVQNSGGTGLQPVHSAEAKQEWITSKLAEPALLPATIVPPPLPKMPPLPVEEPTEWVKPANPRK